MTQFDQKREEPSCDLMEVDEKPLAARAVLLGAFSFQADRLTCR
jgi:hypothetical protein